MSSETGLEDSSLIELFRSEVETHSELLSAALLALERSPSDTSRIDEMMRAAHSIKGAARVVGVEPAVSVAHVMEGSAFGVVVDEISEIQTADSNRIEAFTRHDHSRNGSRRRQRRAAPTRPRSFV